MSVITNSPEPSFWEPLKPRVDEVCFLCGKPLVTAAIVAQEGSVGLLNGVGHHAKRPHVLYLHSECADQLGDKLKLDARTIRFQIGRPTRP